MVISRTSARDLDVHSQSLNLQSGIFPGRKLHVICHTRTRYGNAWGSRRVLGDSQPVTGRKSGWHYKRVEESRLLFPACCVPIITCRPCASQTFPCCPPLFVFASGLIGAFRRGLLARAAPVDERPPGPTPAAPQPVPLRAGGAGRRRGLAEELAHHWLSRGAGAAPGTYYCVPRTVSGRSVARMRGWCCAGRRGWGELRGCRGRGAGARGAGAEARGAGAASQSRQPPPPAGAVQQRMPASRSPLLCAPAISSTSSWIRAARWGWGTAASAPAKPAPQAWPARWVSSAGLLQPSAPRCPAPPGRGWRDREFLFACGFPCLPLLPVAARRAHALGGSRGPAAAARAASAEAPRAGRSVPDSGPGSPPCALPVTPRAVLRPRLRGRFFYCYSGALLVLPTLPPPNLFCRVCGTVVFVCPRTARDGSGSPRPPAPSPLVGALTGRSPPLPPQCAVQVKLELGHRAQVRKKPTVEGFTHDWMVFVRGPEHSNIQHFVEKVIFHLHESFPRPKRGSGVSPGMSAWRRPGAGAGGGSVPVSVENKSGRQCGGGLPGLSPAACRAVRGREGLLSAPHALAAAGCPLPAACGLRAWSSRGSGSRLLLVSRWWVARS